MIKKKPLTEGFFCCQISFSQIEAPQSIPDRPILKTLYGSVQPAGVEEESF